MSKATQEARRAAEIDAAEARARQYQSLVMSLAAAGRLPFEPEAKQEMARALLEETRDQAHAERAIRAALDTGAPEDGWSLAELRNFIGKTKEPPATEGLWNPQCKSCAGTGWEPVYGLRTTEHGRSTCQILSREQYDELCRAALDRRKQELVTAAKRCPAGCSPRMPYRENTR